MKIQLSPMDCHDPLNKGINAAEGEEIFVVQTSIRNFKTLRYYKLILVVCESE